MQVCTCGSVHVSKSACTHVCIKIWLFLPDWQRMCHQLLFMQSLHSGNGCGNNVIIPPSSCLTFPLSCILLLFHVQWISHLVVVSTFTAYPWSQMKRHLSSQTNKQINNINKNRDIAFQFLPEKCRCPLNMYFYNLATWTLQINTRHVSLFLC